MYVGKLVQLPESDIFIFRNFHVCMYVCMYVCNLVIVFAGLNPKAFMEMTEGKKRCLPLLGFVLAKSVEGFTLTTILGSSSF